MTPIPTCWAKHHCTSSECACSCDPIRFKLRPFKGGEFGLDPRQDGAAFLSHVSLGQKQGILGHSLRPRLNPVPCLLSVLALALTLTYRSYAAISCTTVSLLVSSPVSPSPEMAGTLRRVTDTAGKLRWNSGFDCPNFCWNLSGCHLESELGAFNVQVAGICVSLV